jgi:hypothetical protein
MKIRFFLIFLVSCFSIFAGDIGDYQIRLTEVTMDNFPGLHSYTAGEYDGEWLLIGGRIEGLHSRQPRAAFLASENNTNIYVINPETGEVWFAPLPAEPLSIFDQLQSTNMQFEQYHEILYLTGGYGYSTSAGDYITYSYLTAIDIPRLISSVKQGEIDLKAIYQSSDERVQVTGGQLRRIGERFFLVGGNRFTGQYRPMSGGRGFTQEYTNQIRSFLISRTDGYPVLMEYQAVTDKDELHRRDYNLVPQIFPDGTQGLTAFSGVFQYGADIPWLNTVDIFTDRYTPVIGFSQNLNQYHTANMAVHDAESNTMYTIFFGGIGRYGINEAGELIDDPLIPFRRTISMISRNDTGQMMERQIGMMPGYLGTAAEFFPCPDTQQNDQGIIMLGSLRPDIIKAGYIYGGIESSSANIFNINDGTQSRASNRMFLVELVKDQHSRD